MAAAHLHLLSLPQNSHSFALNSLTHFRIAALVFSPTSKLRTFHPPKCSSDDSAAEPSKSSRRGRKKSSTTTISSPSTSTATKKSRRPRKSQPKKDVSDELNVQNEQLLDDEEIDDYDDGIDFPYESPPLVCCFGAAQKEFVPTVRVSTEQMHPDIYSQWKMLQWNPPEFVRAPGGPPSNVAISHVRLGGRAAFMGKVGNDEFGQEMVLLMNKEKVQTRGVKFDSNSRTACTYMKFKFDDGKIKAETVKDCPEDSLLSSELNLSVLKEVNSSSHDFIYYTNSVLLTTKFLIIAGKDIPFQLRSFNISFHALCSIQSNFVV